MYDSLTTTAKEFPRSVENQLLQLYHPTHYLQDRQDSVVYWQSVPRAQCSKEAYDCAWLICHCMSRRTTSCWRPSKNSDTGPAKAQTQHLAWCFKRKKLRRFPKSRQKITESELVSVPTSCYSCIKPDSKE